MAGHKYTAKTTANKIFFWDGTQVLLHKVTGKQMYLDDIEATFTDWMPGGSIPYTPKGLAYRLQWGSNRYAGTHIHMSLIVNSGFTLNKYLVEVAFAHVSLEFLSHSLKKQLYNFS